MNTGGTSPGRMKIKITREPRSLINGISLRHYRQGEVYDVPPSLAELLVMEDYAIIEMRDGDRTPVPVEVERRRREA